MITLTSYLQFRLQGSARGMGLLWVAVVAGGLVAARTQAAGAGAGADGAIKDFVTTESLVLNYRQIVIEGLVVEVDSTVARRWGVEMYYQRNPGESPSGNLNGAVLKEPNNFPTAPVPVFNPATNPPSINAQARPIGIGATFDSFETDAGLFQARVRAAVTQGKANILSQPIAVAQTGKKVILKTVDEIPFQDITTGENHVATLDISKLDVGISMEVTANLRPPERVGLSLDKLNVGHVTGYLVIRGVPRPVIQNSDLQTEIELANNESLLISGIKSTREATEHRGIPVLKDIPVLGLLFGAHTKITERTDILFLVTPHLLSPGENPLIPRDFENKSFPRTL